MRLIWKNKKKVKKIKDLSTGTLQKEDRRNKADISITCHTKKKNMRPDTWLTMP